MTGIVDVDTGSVACASGGILRAVALGSCIAVVLFDPGRRLGGIAHIMLPGRADPRSDAPARYAHTGIGSLIRGIERLHGGSFHLQACLIGGANVLKRSGDSIGRENRESIVSFLGALGITVAGERTGGFERYSAILNLNEGTVAYTVGDGPVTELLRFSDLTSEPSDLPWH